MSKLSTQVKELKAYIRGQEKQIVNQKKIMDNMHKTILEDIEKIEHLEATRKHHISVVAYLEFKLEQTKQNPRRHLEEDKVIGDTING